MNRRRGIAIYMMLVALAILGVFAVVSSRLWLATLRTTQRAGEATTRAMRLDGMLRQLRQDVWNAKELRSEDPGPVTIVSPDSRTVVWRAADDGTLTRSEGDESRRWSEPGVKPSLRLDSPLVVLSITQGSDVDELVLPSQLLLVKRGTP